jgi:ligand-binding sensor domain-containing protein
MQLAKSMVMLAIMLMAGALSAQMEGWDYYNSNSYPKGITHSQEYIWVASDGGLCRIDRINGDKQIFNTYSSEIPTNEINCLIADSTGGVWIGTPLGLILFDGSTWAVFNTGNTILPSNYINCLEIDRVGDLWIGTGQGLVKYNGTVFQIIIYDLPDIYYNVECIRADLNNDIWFGASYWWYWGGIGLCFEERLYRYSAGIIHNYPDFYFFPGDMAVDSNNNLWMTTFWSYSAGSLARYDGADWTFYNNSNSGFTLQQPKCVRVGQNDVVWVGGECYNNQYGSIARYDGTDWTIYSTVNSGLPGPLVHCLHIDDQNVKWFGYTEGVVGGVVSYDEENWQLYSIATSGLVSNTITCIAVEADNTKWIGSYTNYRRGGIVAYDGTSWETYTLGNSPLPSYNVKCVAVDPQGTKWIGLSGDYNNNQGGMARFDGTDWTIYQTSNSGIPHNDVDCIAIDQTGTRWLGSGPTEALSSRISRFLNTWIVYYPASSMLYSEIRCAVEATDGRMWFGSYGSGISSYWNQNWIHHFFTQYDPLTNYVQCCARDSDGNLWFGTRAGLLRYSSQGWTLFNTANSGLIDNDIICMEFDNNNMLWMGTINSGVIRFDGTQWASYNTGNSVLLTNKINCLAVDNDNVKWFGTDMGLFSYSGSGVLIDDMTSDNLIPIRLEIYPNPIGRNQSVTFRAEKALMGNIDIYNVKGQKVMQLKYKNSDRQVIWNGIDKEGKLCSSGVYLVRLTSDKGTTAKKLIIMN